MHKPLYSGDYVQIGDLFYQIGGLEPFQYDTGEESNAFFSANPSGSTSAFVNITELEPDDFPPHLFWVVPGIEDGQKYFFKIPTGTNRFGTDVTKSIGYIDTIRSPFYAPNDDFGFYLIEDYYPQIAARNDALIELTPKVYFTGFKYGLVKITDATSLQRLKSGSLPVKKITLGGVKNQ